MAHDPDYAAHVGVVEEGPELADQYVQKSEKLTAVEDMLRGFNGQADTAMDRFLGKAPGRPSTLKGGKLTLKDFNARVAALNETVQSGGVVLPNLDQVAPTANSMLQLTAINAANFLLEKAPKNPFAGQMPALARPWQPSETALQKWNRYVEAIEQPQQVLNRLAHGAVMPEHVEALASVYPKLLEDLRQRMLSRMSELQTSLPYAKRLALSGFLGPDILGMSSEQLALFQGLHMAAQQPKMGGKGPKPDGRQDVNQQENLETQAQRMEKRT
jgi:hypothetical protein